MGSYSPGSHGSPRGYAWPQGATAAPDHGPKDTGKERTADGKKNTDKDPESPDGWTKDNSTEQQES